MSATGQCQLATDRATISGTRSGFTAQATTPIFVPLTGIVFTGGGPLDIGIQCNEVDLDMTYFDARVTAVALSQN